MKRFIYLLIFLPLFAFTSVDTGESGIVNADQHNSIDADQHERKRLVYIVGYIEADGTEFGTLRVYPEQHKQRAILDMQLLMSQPCGRKYTVKEAVLIY